MPIDVKRIDWASVALKWGPGWTIAIVLVGFLIRTVTQANTDISHRTEAIAAAVTKHVADMAISDERADFRAKRQEKISLAICLNGANTPRQIAVCQEATR